MLYCVAYAMPSPGRVAGNSLSFHMPGSIVPAPRLGLGREKGTRGSSDRVLVHYSPIRSNTPQPSRAAFIGLCFL